MFFYLYVIQLHNFSAKYFIFMDIYNFNMFKIGITSLRAYFVRTLKVDVCRSWGFGKDLAFLQYHVGI
jgi:hypothetical protein